MPMPHFILLYVDEPQKSAAFYARLLERQPLNSSPNFVMFELSPNLRLGLWARRDVKPAPGGAGDTGELAMAVGTRGRGRSAVRRLEGQRRSDPAGAGDDGLRPDLPRRRPGRTSASGVLPRALTSRGLGPSGESAPRLKGSNLISHRRSRTDRSGYAGRPRCPSKSGPRRQPGIAQRPHTRR